MKDLTSFASRSSDIVFELAVWPHCGSRVPCLPWPALLCLPNLPHLASTAGSQIQVLTTDNVENEVHSLGSQPPRMTPKAVSYDWNDPRFDKGMRA